MVEPNTLEFPVLIGDIGGTNARFQIVESPGADPVRFDPVRTAQYKTPSEAIHHSVLAQTHINPKSALLAGAGPITPAGLNLTNCHWNLVPEDILSLGSIKQFVLMNDFEAQALSLPLLAENDGELIGSSSSSALDNATKAVLGPGTGLGVGILVQAGGKWIPVAGEGGHVDIGPRNDREYAIWQRLETIAGRISGEQIICGDGLINLYRACCRTDATSIELQTAAEISSAAMANSNPQAHEALHLFCTTLGRAAGDLALISGAKGGVYIAGGIGQKILPFLKSSGFRGGFDDKAPHRSMMETIATIVVTHPLPALLGLAAFASSPESYLIDIRIRTWQ